MAYTTVTRTGLGGNLGKSLGSALFGIILFLGSFALLWFNEGRAVRRAQDLEEGASTAISVDASALEAANEGKLIHTSGRATTDEQLQDDAFGVSAQVLKLKRKVEMYQWKERSEKKTRKRVGGGSETTTSYSYHEVWAEERINSSAFENPGYDNPMLPISSQTQVAETVELGAFTLSSGLVGSINAWSKLPPPVEAGALPAAIADRARSTTDGWFVGDPQNPMIGDLRIGFEVVEPTDVSVLAQQVGNHLSPYKTSSGGTLEELKLGTLSLEAMVQILQDENTMLTWLLRFGGFLMMAIGLAMLFSPLVALGDIIPFVGSLVGAGVMLFAGVVSIGLSLLTISAAWIFYRPLVGIPLALVAVAGLVFVVRKGGQARAAKAAQG